jgi:hypothetical protein
VSRAPESSRAQRQHAAATARDRRDRDRRSRPRSPRSGSPRSRGTGAVKSMQRSMSADSLGMSTPSRSSVPSGRFSSRAEARGQEDEAKPGMSRFGSRPFIPPAGDEMDEMWCGILQLFPEYPNWTLVKEKTGVYRMGHPAGKKILCKISHDGLQVRVGGGWMPAVAFLERHGPIVMSGRPEDSSPSRGMGRSGSSGSLDQVELPPSMERLLLPTKAWAQRIGINTTPDIREQRRHLAAEDTSAYSYRRASTPPRVPDDDTFAAQVPSTPAVVVVQPTPRRSEGQPVVLTRAAVAPSSAATMLPMGGSSPSLPTRVAVIPMGTRL